MRQLGFTTEESKQSTSSSAKSHTRARSAVDTMVPAADEGHRSRSRVARNPTRTASDSEPPQGEWKEVHRRNQKPKQSIRESTHQQKEKMMTEINGNLHVKLAEREHEIEAQKLQQEELKQEYSKLHAENARLKKERDGVSIDKANHKFYVSRYDYILRNLILPYANDKGLQFDDRQIKTLDFVLQPLLQNAMEADVLQDQVDELQQNLLTRVSNENAIPDEQLAQDFRSLVAQIKTLSRLLFPYEGADIVEILGIGGISSGSGPYQWSGRARTKRFLETWVWSILYQAIFKAPFAIFGAEGQTANNLWFSMFHNDHQHGWPVPSFASEEWRRATMKRLVTLVDEEIITKGIAKTEYRWLEEMAVKDREQLIEYIGSGLRLIAPQVDLSQVRQIVDKAYTLAMQMGLQHSRLQVTYPRIGDEVKKTEMMTVADEDEEDEDDRVVGLVFNPGLAKWGDAHGKNYDHRYDIVRALVQPEERHELSSGISLL